MTAAIPANALLVDSGFLVALFRRRDRLRGAARTFLAASRAPLETVAPVVVETCYFLDAREKCNLLEWIRRGALRVHEIPVNDYPKVSSLIDKYADRDPDFTDMALVWLATEVACHRVVTVDVADFEIYRGKSGKRFELIEWLS